MIIALIICLVLVIILCFALCNVSSKCSRLEEREAIKRYIEEHQEDMPQ